MGMDGQQTTKELWISTDGGIGKPQLTQVPSLGRAGALGGGVFVTAVWYLVSFWEWSLLISRGPLGCRRQPLADGSDMERTPDSVMDKEIQPAWNPITITSRAIPWNVVAQPGAYMRTEQKFLRVYHFLIATDHSRAVFVARLAASTRYPCRLAQMLGYSACSKPISGCHPFRGGRYSLSNSFRNPTW